MTHIYPNGTNFPFSATDFFWEFFNQTSLSGTKEIVSSLDDCKIYPNPSVEQMIIDLGSAKDISKYDILVFNMMGQQVFASKDNHQTKFILSKEKTGSGIFIVQVQSNEKRIAKRIIFE